MSSFNLKDFLLEPICLRRDVRVSLEDLFAKHLTRDMDVYDIGCGDKPFKKFLDARVHKYIGVDIANGFYDASHIDIIGDACNVPVENSKADAVISNQVIEHLEKPMASLYENNRLLKKNGILFLAFPFLYPVHAIPRDFQRYTEYSIRTMLEDSGFKITDFKKIGGFWYSMGVFAGLYLGGFNKGILKKLRIIQVLNFIVKAFFLGMHKLEGGFLKMIGKNPEDFRSIWASNYVITAQKVRDIAQPLNQAA